MKLTLALLSLAALASAAPLEVDIADRSPEPTVPKFRIGHPGAKHTHTTKDTILVEEAIHILPFPLDSDLPFPQPNSAIAHGNSQAGSPGKKPCHGGSKSVELANTFRKMLGMPTIVVEPVEPKILRLDFIEIPPPPPHTPVAMIDGQIEPHRHHHHHHTVVASTKPQQARVKAWHERPFTERLTHALMSLGRWEGRFVAFVLGCGIGVLLRLFWVMGLLMTRSFRNRRTEDEDELEHEVILTEEEQYLLPPPEYTDEKVALAVQEEQRRAN